MLFIWTLANLLNSKDCIQVMDDAGGVRYLAVQRSALQEKSKMNHRKQISRDTRGTLSRDIIR